MILLARIIVATILLSATLPLFVAAAVIFIVAIVAIVAIALGETKSAAT
jgi:hypothetical protein